VLSGKEKAMTLSKNALLGASDIVEQELDLPELGGSVRIRTLPAAYSAQAQSDATEFVTIRGEQTVRVNMPKLEALQVLHGMIDPKLDTLDEALGMAEQLGPSWRRIIRAIDKLSGVDKEALESANRLFQPGGQGEKPGSAASNGVAVGSGGPGVPLRTGVGTEDAGE
jgi:hypothetical protein